MLRKIGLAAALAVLCAAGPAPAATYELQIETAGRIELTSFGKVTFVTSVATVECNMSFRGTLSTGPIPAQAGESIGALETAFRENCTGGEIEFVLELPWGIRIESIGGTQPNAVSELLLLFNVSIQFRTLGGFRTCLYKGEPGARWVLSGSNPYTGGTWVLLNNTLRRIGVNLCPTTMRMAGTLIPDPGQGLSFT